MQLRSVEYPSLDHMGMGELGVLLDIATFHDAVKILYISRFQVTLKPHFDNDHKKS